MPRKKKPPVVANGGAYGTRGDMEQLAAAAPTTAPTPTGLSAGPSGQPPAQGGVSALDVAAAHPAPTGVPLFAPTTRPDEPWTAGIDFGPGPSAAPRPAVENPETIRMWMPALERLASSPDASAQTRNVVRFLRSNA